MCAAGLLRPLVCVEVGAPLSTFSKLDIRTFLPSSGDASRPTCRPCSCCESSQPSIWATKRVGSPHRPATAVTRGGSQLCALLCCWSSKPRALFQAIRCLAAGVELLLNRETSTQVTGESSRSGRLPTKKSRIVDFFSVKILSQACILQIHIGTVSSAEKQRKDNHLKFHSCR